MFVLTQVINSDKWHGVLYMDPELTEIKPYLAYKELLKENRKLKRIIKELENRLMKFENSPVVMTDKGLLEEIEELTTMNNFLRSEIKAARRLMSGG